MEPKQEPTLVSVQSRKDTGEWSAADEKRIRRRMDLRIMPPVFVLYLATFIDRQV